MVWTRSVLRFAAIVLLLGLLTGCSTGQTRTQEFVNSGAPLRPAGATKGDWFTRTAPAEQSTATAAVRASMPATTLLRGDVSNPTTVTVEPTTLSGKRVMNGFVAKYQDRVILVVTPTDRPLATQEILDHTIRRPNTLGQTRVWKRTSVRGNDAVWRPAGEQKWDGDGDGVADITQQYPAILRWTESAGEELWLEYQLVGDLPLGRLTAIADEMTQ